MGCAIALLVLNFISVCLALAGLVASLTGYAWFSVEGNNGAKIETGLFRRCTTQANGDMNCVFNDNIFDFENNLDNFVILILHIIACGCIFFGLISTLTMFCCMNSKGCWCCGAFTVSLKMFLGAGAGMAAMIYAEVQMRDRLESYRGWSNIVGWVGAGIGLVSFFLSCSMCCIKPNKHHGGNVNVVVNNPPYAPGKDYPMVNRGYQHGY